MKWEGPKKKKEANGEGRLEKDNRNFTRKTSETTTKRRDFINLLVVTTKGTYSRCFSKYCTVHTHYREAAVKTFRMYGTFICLLSTCVRCKIQTSQIATKEYLQYQ
jgi:hypothetical protein